jgi:hypothetical protein
VVIKKIKILPRNVAQKSPFQFNIDLFKSLFSSLKNSDHPSKKKTSKQFYKQIPNITNNLKKQAWTPEVKL